MDYNFNKIEKPKPEPQVIYSFDREISVPDLGIEINNIRVRDDDSVCIHVKGESIDAPNVCGYDWFGNPDSDDPKFIKLGVTDNKAVGIRIRPLNQNGEPLGKLWDPDMKFHFMFYTDGPDDIVYEEII